MGRLDVDQMLAEMPASLYVEWQAFFKIEPFGAEFQDVHFAQLAALIFNANRGKASAKQAKDFMLHKKAKKPFSPEQFFAGLKSALTFRRE